MLPGDRPITMLPADAVETGKPSAWSSQAALSFVVLFGIANLFADTSYEGARSVTGPFLGTLGASGLIVGTGRRLGRITRLYLAIHLRTMGGP